tara:strand:+ start:164 stop:1477 length:1314 start_codon:yes stop_codon:yes gene_type:complete
MKYSNDSNFLERRKLYLLKNKYKYINIYFLIKLFIFSLFLLILFKPTIFTKFGAYWHLPDYYPFLDLKGRLSHIEANRLGINTYAEANQFDPLGRVNNKPSISLFLSFTGIGLKDSLLIGSIIVSTFLIQAISLLRKCNLILFIISTLYIFNPNSLFAIERGNDDLVIFIISFGLPYLLLIKKRISNLLSIIIIWFLGAMKYYPFILYSLLINKRLKQFRQNIFLISIGVAIWLKIYWNEFLFLTRNSSEKGAIPLNPTNLYGFKILDLWLLIKNNEGYDLRLINGSIIHLIFISLFLTTSFIIYLIINKEYFIIKNKLISINTVDKLYFLIGSSMLVFCYLSADNSSYRMIFTIFLLPLILSLIDHEKINMYIYPKISLFLLILLILTNWLPLFGTFSALKVKVILDYVIFCTISGLAIFLFHSELSFKNKKNLDA